MAYNTLHHLFQEGILRKQLLDGTLDITRTSSMFSELVSAVGYIFRVPFCLRKA